MDGHTDSIGAGLLPNLWDEAHAARLTPEGRLLYRSNLLGADKRITNYGGGNPTCTLFDSTDGAISTWRGIESENGGG